MPRNNIEGRYIDRMDNDQAALEVEQRREAEDALREILMKTLEGAILEKTTKDEDAGATFTAQHSQIRGQQTDLILSKEDRLLLALQITTGKSELTKQKKGTELMKDPFPFLRNQLVPKAVVALDWGEAKGFLADKDPSKHPLLLEQFFNGVINSLKLGEMLTHDPLKKKLAQETLAYIEGQQKRLAARNKRGQTAH